MVACWLVALTVARLMSSLALVVPGAVGWPIKVYRKQGLATGLVNFLKSIAAAHEMDLYARCDMVRGGASVTWLHMVEHDP